MSDKPRPLGGWLTIPALGMIVGPLVIAYNVWENARMLQGPLIASLEQEFPGFHSTVVFETIFGAAWLAIQLCLAIMFFRKLAVVPKLMVASLAINLVMATENAFQAASILRQPVEFAGHGGVLHAAVLAVIWIPYFLLSKRVKETFTRGQLPHLAMTAGLAGAKMPAA